jgi:hypothetical protein
MGPASSSCGRRDRELRGGRARRRLAGRRGDRGSDAWVSRFGCNGPVVAWRQKAPQARSGILRRTRTYALVADGFRRASWFKKGRLGRNRAAEWPTDADNNAPGRLFRMTLSGAVGSITLRLLAQSHLERRIGNVQAQAHQCDDDGSQEETETDNQHMFHARRTRLAGNRVQGFLLCVRAALIGLKTPKVLQIGP